MNLQLIVDILKQGKGTKEMCSQLNFTLNRLRYTLNFLRKIGVIEKIGYGVWQITPEFASKTNDEIMRFIDEKKRSVKKSSLGLRTKANLHALNINIPIISGNIDLNGYEVKLKNWNAQFKRIPNLGITLRNNNNKSLSVFVWSRAIFDTLSIPTLCHAAVHTVCSMFKQQDIELDYFGWRVTTLHIMIRNEELDNILNKGMKIEVILDRNAEKISEKDITQKARAWIDSSPYKGIETNDLAYYSNYITMPENISKVAQGFEKFLNEFLPVHKQHAENIKTHTAVLKEMQKSFKKFNNLLSQKKLGDFL